ncbi:MAG: CehA/McbA family metallohydrolase [Planctomycetia bacterium]|nr:CehA/McbA family metallohydrolase [Planctomycetia bacterium]
MHAPRRPAPALAVFALFAIVGVPPSGGSSSAIADDLPLVQNVELQPLAAQADRVVQALGEILGEPISEKDLAALKEAKNLKKADDAVAAIQKVLDKYCLAGVNINPESRVKVQPGPAKPVLMQHGWRMFVVKVHNEGGVTAQLRCLSPNAPVLRFGSNQPAPNVPRTSDTKDQFLAIELFEKQPLTQKLSGLPLEYRILGLYSRDSGKREAKLAFDVGQGTQDLGFRNEMPVLFDCRPAVSVVIDVVDHDGKPCTGAFTIRDQQGRVYPSRLRRLAPDLFFHDQVYRASGESILLPPGKYTVAYTRGPEYTIETREITVPEKESHKESFRLRRWIHLAETGWFSGDHHVHAAGCKHYDVPSQGVTPDDMMRHILGEDLNVGCVLTWGPCWYYQKEFFSGDVSKLSTSKNLMRYDVEVSGFPSQHAGHLCLLRLKEDDYEYPEPTEFDWQFGAERGRFKGTKTEKIGEWPSWDLPILAWGKKQGAVVGFSHSGWGLKVNATRLPTYEMPPFDGIGANEFVVDTVHGVCDFISAVDTPSVWELNIWYHTLNCGMTTRISGETDFPCIYGEKVGLGRAYVKLPKDGPLTYDEWVSGIKDGRSYCTDGLSHLYDFSINGLGVGEVAPGAKRETPRPSVLAVKSGQGLDISVNAAALLAQQPNEGIRNRPLEQQPYWHVERARIGDTRKVPVELIVNGIAVERQEIEADGKVSQIKFSHTPKISSWVAIRIFPSSHTNPIFVEVDNQPIRASRKSAEWCLKAADVCWEQKVKQTRPHEREAARAAYDVAKEAYAKILKEAQGE